MASPKNKDSKQQRPGPKKQKADEAKPDLKKHMLPLLGIVLISFFAYLPVLRAGFVNWDDQEYILNNQLIQSINLKAIFSQYVQGNYHPFTMLAYAIEYKLFGLNPGGYHAFNLLLHLSNVVLVFYVVLLLSDKAEVALVASLLFGIHPIHVESVAWASELKDLLYSFFFLASYFFYLKYIKASRNKYLIFSLLLFVCSAFSKAMAVSLPVLLLLTDFFMQKKVTSKMLVNKIPFFIISIIFGVVAVLAQQEIKAVMSVSYFTLTQKIIFACYSFITYIVKIILPINLNVYYPYPIKSGEAIPISFYAYVILFIGLVAFVIYSLRSSKKIFFATGFFAITVFLVLQLLPVGSVIMADRYSYIPSIGLFYLAGEGFYWLRNKRNNFKLSATIALLSFTVFFTVKTYSQSKIWKDSMTLWNYVIAKDNTVGAAYNNRGVVLMRDNKTEEALKDFERAVTLRNDDAEAFSNLGYVLTNQQKYDDALKAFNRAIELKPYFIDAIYNRGITLIDKKDYEAALKDFNKALELKPDYADVYNYRGIAYSRLNKTDEALRDYNKTIELAPNSPYPYVNRGQLLQSQNRNDEAIADYDRAIQLNPNVPEAYYNRAGLEYAAGKKDLACADYQQAINLGLQAAVGIYGQYCK